LAAARRQFGERNYLLNGRPLDGERIPKTYAVGAVGEQDVSSNDVHLQSTFYPERCVGPCRVLPIVDKQIGYISGIYCGWRANAAAVRLAILNSASAKQDFCERLGFSISEDEWFSVHHCQYLMDRGEGNCEEIFGVLRNIRSSGEYVQTGRADFKGRVEQTHRILHATDLPGATGGKPPSRGENDPAEDACLNITEFMQEVVEAVLWHNNKACVPHLLSLEMRRDHVTPTRMEIMKWATANGYNRSKSCSESRLVSALCPEIEAVVTESGIYLTALRNGRSGDRLLLEKCRYLGAFAKEKNWLAKARKDGRFNIQARFNPNDLRKIWYHDNDAGLVEFLLSTDDPGFPECATYEDVIATRTYETIIHQPVREDALQADSDRQLRGQARVEKAKIRTSEAKARVGSKGKRTARDRRENNILENQLGGQSQVLVPSMQAIPLHVDSSHTVRRVEQLQSRYFVEAPCRRA